MPVDMRKRLDRLEEALGRVGHDICNAALDAWFGTLRDVKENVVRSMAPSEDSWEDRAELRHKLEMAISEEYGRRVPEYGGAVERARAMAKPKEPRALSAIQLREGYELLVFLDDLGDSMADVVESVVAAIEGIAGPEQAERARVELEAAAERATAAALERRREWIVSE